MELVSQGEDLEVQPGPDRTDERGARSNEMTTDDIDQQPTCREPQASMNAATTEFSVGTPIRDRDDGLSWWSRGATPDNGVTPTGSPDSTYFVAGIRAPSSISTTASLPSCHTSVARPS